MKNKSNLLNLIWVITMIIITVNCKQSNSNSTKESSNNSLTSDFKISIDTFSTFPQEIEGCSCYFSNNSGEFKKGSYIYMNDFAETSFLKINGILVKFKQTEFKNIDSTTTEAKAVCEDYELVIKVKNGEQSGDETQLKSGTIILTDKKGHKVTKAFYGECGC